MTGVFYYLFPNFLYVEGYPGISYLLNGMNDTTREADVMTTTFIERPYGTGGVVEGYYGYPGPFDSAAHAAFRAFPDSFYYMPNNPSAGVMLPNDKVLFPDGSLGLGMRISRTGDGFYRGNPLISDTRILPPPQTSAAYHEKMAYSNPMYAPPQPPTYYQNYPQPTFWEALFGARPVY